MEIDNALNRHRDIPADAIMVVGDTYLEKVVSRWKRILALTVIVGLFSWMLISIGRDVFVTYEHDIERRMAFYVLCLVVVMIFISVIRGWRTTKSVVFFADRLEIDGKRTELERIKTIEIVECLHGKNRDFARENKLTLWGPLGALAIIKDIADIGSVEMIKEYCSARNIQFLARKQWMDPAILFHVAIWFGMTFYVFLLSPTFKSVVMLFAYIIGYNASLRKPSLPTTDLPEGIAETKW